MKEERIQELALQLGAATAIDGEKAAADLFGKLIRQT
jgi:hypothetical protein